MSQTNFIFLRKEFPILFNIGMTAEINLHADPVTTLFKLRQFGEKISEILFEEHRLDFPPDNTFNNRIKTLEFEKLLPRSVIDFFSI
ncbi:MAG TPA: hypothetical protein VNS32_12210, partial [Flavisolibacter sp.]|nr:hypothetical protein [Flavisolibacter sp.]